MKYLYLFAIVSLSATLLNAQEIILQFEDVDSFTDFSVYGMTEEKTLDLFEAEIDDTLTSLEKKYLKEGQTMVITFTDIDMAGDIQPWRNRYDADIRYVEDVYPPRLKFTYTLTDSEGKVLKEGEDSISDLAYLWNSLAAIKTRYNNFFYETTLLEDWFRKNFKKND
jgi:hypothetical protein